MTPKPNRNMKSIFVGDDGNVTKGNMKSQLKNRIHLTC